MKRIAFFLSILCFLSCSNDDNQINPAGDTWVLDNVVCFCYFGDNFDFSTHTIRFDAETKTVFIENDEATPFIADSGSYPYLVDGAVVTIQGKEYRYQEDGDTLTLTYVDEPLIADDEVTYYYIKN